MVGKVAEAFVGFYGLVGEHMISADSVRLEMHEVERHFVFFMSHPLCPLKWCTEINSLRIFSFKASWKSLSRFAVLRFLSRIRVSNLNEIMCRKRRLWFHLLMIPNNQPHSTPVNLLLFYCLNGSTTFSNRYVDDLYLSKVARAELVSY